MELNQLQYVVVIAKCKSFTHAAEILCLSQPALSQQISKLEEELGIKLFKRTTRFVSLTSAGQLFIAQAENILLETKKLRFSMQEHAGTLKGKFIIGITPIIDTLKLIGLITSFYKKHPELDIEIIEAGSCVLLDQLCQSQIDAALLTLPVSKKANTVEFFPFINDEIVLLLPVSHPLFTKETIDLTAVKEENFIFFNYTMATHNIIMEACHNVGFIPRNICECRQIKTAANLVKNKVGLLLVPLLIAKSMKIDVQGIDFIQLINPQKCSTGLAIRKEPYPALAVTAFCTFIKNNAPNITDTL